MKLCIWFTCNFPITHITIIFTIDFTNTLRFNNRTLESFCCYNSSHSNTVSFWNCFT